MPPNTLIEVSATHLRIGDDENNGRWDYSESQK
jgi:hypothetical protein